MSSSPGPIPAHRASSVPGANPAPKVSVVIPAFNSTRFLAETINSVLAQTYPLHEVLVIDDGSTDNSADIAESFPAPVRVIRRSNSRQAATRNFGVQQATGEWIAFIDADDLWEPNKIARQVEEITRNPTASLCYTARIEFTQHGNTRALGNIVRVPSPAHIRAALYRNTTFMPSSVLIRRSAYLAAGGFNTHFKLIEDWDFWLRLLHSGTTFAACPEPLLLYRLHTGNASLNAILALAELKHTYRVHVYPRLPRATRWLSRQISQSGQEAVAAYVLRKIGDPRHLSMMATSILRNPFVDPHRYKVLAHMLYTRLQPAGQALPGKNVTVRYSPARVNPRMPVTPSSARE